MRSRRSYARRRDPQIERRYSGRLTIAIEPEEDGYRATITSNGKQLSEAWFRQKLVRGVQVESDEWYDEIAYTALERADDEFEVDDYAELAPRGSYNTFVVRRRPPARDVRQRSRSARIPILRRARRDEDVAAIEATFRRLSNASKDYLNAYVSSCSQREVEDLYTHVPERERATVRRMIDGDRPAWRDCPRGWEDA